MRRFGLFGFVMLLGSLVVGGCSHSEPHAPQTQEEHVHAVLTHLVHDPNASSDAHNLAAAADQRIRDDHSVSDFQSGK